MKEKDLTKTEFQLAAKELNDVLGIKPPIILDLKIAALKTKVQEAITLIDPEADTFSPECWEILKAMGATGPAEEAVDAEETEEVPEADEVHEEPAPTPKRSPVKPAPAAKKPAPKKEEAVEDAVKEATSETLAEDFTAARTLADLKLLCEEWDCFKDLDLDDVNFKGLPGPKRLKEAMRACLPEDVQKALTTVSVKAKKPKAEKKENAFKGPGIIATIVKAIEDAGPDGISKAEILEKLVAAFPEREAASMKQTVNVQVPARITKERFPLISKDGRFSKA